MNVFLVLNQDLWPVVNFEHDNFKKIENFVTIVIDF